MTIHPDNICIATISWARNEAEEKLLTSSLSELASFQLPVYITDGGSTPSFLEFLHTFQNFHVLQAHEKGVYAQARNSLFAGYDAGTPFIFYTEPDKQAFFLNGLKQLLGEATDEEKTGIYHAARSAKGFGTFPSFQQMLSG